VNSYLTVNREGIVPEEATITITRIGDKYYVNYHQDEKNWVAEKGTSKLEAIGHALKYMERGM